MVSKSFKQQLTYVTYSLPHVTTAWLFAPIAIVQGIYAKYYGLSLTVIATVILFARIFDAVTDPLIGYLSDRSYYKTRTRKPLIFVGGVLFLISSYFLYVPELQANALYFSVCFIFFYLAWTLFEIPHISWASELAQTSNDKTKVYSIRSLANYVGLVAFYSIPLLPIFDTQEITPETLEVSVMIANVLMLVFLVVCVRVTPDADKKQGVDKKTSHNSNQSTELINDHRKDLYLIFKSMLNNRPFLIFIASYLCIGVGSGMWFSLIFLYVDVYLGLGDKFSAMFLFAFFVGIVVTPLWYKLAVRIGKKSTWIIATLLMVVSYFYTGMLKPGETEISQLIVLKVMNTLGVTCLSAIPLAILSEIVDYSTLKYGTERSGTYFSVYTFAIKIISAVATALGLMIAGWFGFDATSTSQNENAEVGLLLAMCGIPGLFSLLGVAFIAFMPINERRHMIIRRYLDRRLLSQ